jgi:uncharacterized OB-fold protein
MGVPKKRAEAPMKGHVGEACPECGNFTMVRNGACLKCGTCATMKPMTDRRRFLHRWTKATPCLI